MNVPSETRPLRRALLRHARAAFGSKQRVEESWRRFGFAAPPDFDAACRESDGFAELLVGLGVEIEWLEEPDRTREEGGDRGPEPRLASLGLDSIYVRDASIETPTGTVLCRMGKRLRASEPEWHERALRDSGRRIAGRIEPPGTLEGGDVVWLDEATVLVGRGYRTNDEGIAQLRTYLADVEVVAVPLPHWKGPDDVFHLMSVLSPIAPDLMLVHSPLLPVPFREWLLQRGQRLVEVAPEELEGQGCNALAVAPRVVVAVEGCPETRRRLEAAGVEVHGYAGREISLKGFGGPTCLTRPLERG